MAKKIINIRLEGSVWHKAKEDAVHNRMSLQDWITCLILKGNSGSPVVEGVDEKSLGGKGKWV